MILVPWDYIKKNTLYLKYKKKEIEKKLTYLGLDTKLIKKESNFYFEFNPLPNRRDLFCWQGILIEISILLNCQINFSIKKKLIYHKEEINIEINKDFFSSFNLALIENIKIKENYTKEYIFNYLNLIKLESGQSFYILDNDNKLEKKKLIESLKNKKIYLEDNKFSKRTKNIFLIAFYLNSEKTKDCCVNVISPNILFENTINDLTSFFDRKKNFKLSLSFYQEEIKNRKIFLENKFIQKKIGTKINPKKIENILKKLNFNYIKKRKGYLLTIPSYRNDISNKESILGDFLKIYDFNNLESYPPKSNNLIINDNEINYKRENEIKKYLSNLGWNEIITYSLVSSEMIDNKKEILKLKNCKLSYHKYYRNTLVYSHLKTINYNLSYGNKNLMFFEISYIYNNLKLEKMLIISGIGKVFNQKFHNFIQELDFYWLKGLIENIFSIFEILKKISFFQSNKNYENIEIFLNKEEIGFVKKLELKNSKNFVWISQISLTKIFNFINNNNKTFSYRIISNFPSSERDLTIIIKEKFNYNKIIEKIKKFEKIILKDAFIIDFYQNDKMKKESKLSVTIRLIFQSYNRNLENREIEEIINNIKNFLKNNYLIE